MRSSNITQTNTDLKTIHKLLQVSITKSMMESLINTSAGMINAAIKNMMMPRYGLYDNALLSQAIKDVKSSPYLIRDSILSSDRLLKTFKNHPSEVIIQPEFSEIVTDRNVQEFIRIPYVSQGISKLLVKTLINPKPKKSKDKNLAFAVVMFLGNTFCHLIQEKKLLYTYDTFAPIIKDTTEHLMDKALETMHESMTKYSEEIILGAYGDMPDIIRPAKEELSPSSRDAFARHRLQTSFEAVNKVWNTDPSSIIRNPITNTILEDKKIEYMAKKTAPLAALDMAKQLSTNKANLTVFCSILLLTTATYLQVCKTIQRKDLQHLTKINTQDFSDPNTQRDISI